MPCNVASPCTNVCEMDPATGWCRGCQRTIDEITRWGMADDAWKKRVIASLATRQIRKG